MKDVKRSDSVDIFLTHLSFDMIGMKGCFRMQKIVVVSCKAISEGLGEW